MNDSPCNFPEHNRNDDELRDSHNLLAKIYETAPIGLCVTDEELRLVHVNRAYCDLIGYVPEELLGQSSAITLPPDLRPFISRIAEALQNGKHVDMPEAWRVLHKDGRVLDVDVTTDKFTRGDGRQLFVTSLIDVTEQNKSAAALRQSEIRLRNVQRLESLGVLAGGIAHDFNNLLTTMMGFAGLASSYLPSKSPARAMIEEIENAVRRAAELTQQMLAFSGKGRFLIQDVDLSTLIRDLIPTLKPMISNQADVRLDLAADLPVIAADESQLRQVLHSLIANASEALRDQPGEISVRTTVKRVENPAVYSPYVLEDLPGGAYVSVQVADTGCGMSDETRAKIFDPFFTTKFTGRGLGLSAVLGVIRGHRAVIKVESQLGKGSTFEVLFPCKTLQGVSPVS